MYGLSMYSSKHGHKMCPHGTLLREVRGLLLIIIMHESTGKSTCVFSYSEVVRGYAMVIPELFYYPI